MRRFRRNSLWEMIVVFGSQAAILGLSALVCLWMISGAKAAETLKAAVNEIREILPSEEQGQDIVAFEMSKTLSEDAVAISFERNFVQLVLTDVAAFPAKLLETKLKEFPRVYIYQYQPNQARVRLYVNGLASEVQSAIQWKIRDKQLSVSLDPSKRFASKAPFETKLASTKVDLPITTKSSASEKKVESTPELTDDETALLRTLTERAEKVNRAKTSAEVAKSPAAAVPVPANPATATTETSTLFDGMKREPAKKTQAVDSSAGLLRLLGNLVLVLALIGTMAFVFRKFVLKKGLSLGGNNPIIKTITNYTISPGRSLTIVRVADEVLVLGVTGANISLITSLGPESGIRKFMEDGSGKNEPKGFGTFLQDQIKSFDNSAGEEPVAPPATGIRESIRDRMRGFKQLT